MVAVTADMDKVSVSGSALYFAPVNETSTVTIHNALEESKLAVKIEGRPFC